MDDIRIEPRAVKQRLEQGRPIVFVDARSEPAWQGSLRQLPGAIRVPPTDIDRYAAAVPPGKTIVTYCT